MSEVVRFDPRTPLAPTVADRAADSTKRVDAAVGAVTTFGDQARHTLSARDLEAHERAVGDLKRLAPEIEALGEWLAQAAAPATTRDVSGQLARLVRDYPNAQGKDLAGFVEDLHSEVLADAPSVGALALAVRALVRRQTFLPSIAEVLEEIAMQEATIAARLALVARAGKALRLADDGIASLRKRVAERREKAVAEVISRIERGKELSGFHPALVAEARKRLPVTESGSEDW